MILIIDDDAAIRASLTVLLKRAGYMTRTASNPDEAIAEVRREIPHLALLDMNFSRFTTGDEGLTLLRQIKVFAPSTPVILMTGWASIDLAVAGIKAGAFDFIAKPWDNGRLLDSIATALKLGSGNRPEAESGISFDRRGIVGHDPALEKVLSTVARIAPTNASVLITGESGTGKELIAEAIHYNSSRRDKPFVKVNLGGMPSTLFESEMFGHKKGAFTDAVADRAGRFEIADGGTIFLDEIGELDMSCQVKLLRVLQERRFEPLGSSRTRTVDVRVICATNADLPRMVAEKRFREDLFYRINLITVELPPLRSRRGDIAALADHFIGRLCDDSGLKRPEITAEAYRRLSSFDFPGNIRELKNIVERAVLVNSGDALTADSFDCCRTTAAQPAPGDNTIAGNERRAIASALERNEGNISRTASELGLSRASLYRRIDKYRLNKKVSDED